MTFFGLLVSSKKGLKAKMSCAVTFLCFIKYLVQHGSSQPNNIGLSYSQCYMYMYFRSN